MERLFWVECRSCQGRFYYDTTLRNAGIKLICPFCHARFLPEEARSLEPGER